MQDQGQIIPQHLIEFPGLDGIFSNTIIQLGVVNCPQYKYSEV